MGKQCSKCVCENKETIISQHGGGDNTATTSHVDIHNILLYALVAVTGCAIAYVFYKRYRKMHQSWVNNEIRSEFFRRLQERVSGRRGADSADRTGNDAI